MTERFKYKNETIDIPEENMCKFKKKKKHTIFFQHRGDIFLRMIQMPEAVKEKINKSNHNKVNFLHGNK